MADDVALSGNRLFNRRDPDELLDIPVGNPAVTATSATSLGEVEQLIAESSAGFIRSMNPKAATGGFVQNSTTETSMLDAVFSMPRVIAGAVYQVNAWGVCRCTAGGPVNMTLRLKNTTDTVTIAAPVVSLATDTQANRPWRFEVVGEGNVVLSNSNLSVGNLLLGAGDTDTLKQAMAQAANAEGSDPQNWDVTLQFSVANSGILAVVYGCQITYALAGA